MESSEWPKTLSEAVHICLAKMNQTQKEAMMQTREENLITFHFGWAVDLRNEFGMWQGNDELIASCEAKNPDDASMTILKEVIAKLKAPK